MKENSVTGKRDTAFLRKLNLTGIIIFKDNKVFKKNRQMSTKLCTLYRHV